MLKSIVNGAEHDIVSIPMKGKNLFDYVSYFDSTFTNYNQFFDYADLQLSANTTYTLSTSYTEVGTNPRNTSFIVAKPSDTPMTASGGISSTSPITITTGSDGKLRLYKRISGSSEHPTKSQFDNGEWLMLNLGSQALPYEPYGYQEGWEVRDNQDRLIWGREDELQTATGTLPFKGYSLPVKVKSLLGNAVQNGTPAPDNIIIPEMCGVRTGNLWGEEGFSARAITSTHEHTDANTYGTTLSTTIGKEVIITQSAYPTGTVGYQNGFFCIDVDFSKYEIGDKVTLSFDYICNEVHAAESQVSTTIYAGKNNNSIPCALSSGNWSVSGRLTVVITIIADMNPYVEVRLCGNSITVKNIMLNLGSTALPYEPYGWKVPLENHGENLWSEDYTGIDGNLKYVPVFVGDGTFTMSTDTPYYSGNAPLFLLSGNVVSGASTPINGVYNGVSRTVNSSNGYVTIAFRRQSELADPTTYKTMLTPGSTPKPYSPYLNETIPVYLGEVPTVRRIKKLVLTGNEQIRNYDATYSRFSIVFSDSLILGVRKSPVISSHLIGISDGRGIADVPNNAIYSDAASGNGRWFIKTTDYTTAADFKSYLAAQYAAGNPVTVWYVLATPQTGIVNEPLAKISTYADELTTIKVHGLSAPLYGIGDYKDTLNLSTGVVTRKVKKLVLTGTETFNIDEYLRFSIGIDSIKYYAGGRIGRSYCSHYECLYHEEPYDNDWNNVYYQNGMTLFFHDSRFDNVSDFKSYLAAQYQAGTPVTVWYILATPETETVTVPTGMTGEIEGYLTQISTPTPEHQSIPKWNGKEETDGTYAVTVYTLPEIPTTTGKNTLTVDTTTAPYNVTINGHIKYTYWGKIREDVRSGLAQTKFPVGTILYDNEDETTGRAFQVVGYDKHFDPSLTAQGYTHSMTLCEYKLTDIYQFDAIEAFLYTSKVIPAGTYRFTIPNYDATYGGNKTYYFTSTADLPKNSQIVMNWPYQQTPKTVTAYSPTSSITAMENTTITTGWNGLTLTEYVSGESPSAIDLGTIAGPSAQAGTSNYGEMNHIHRARYGSNNYLQSGLRQYLNASTAANTWWKPQTIFDRPYGNRNQNGKLSKLNQNLVSVLATPTIQSRTNSYFETTSLDGTTFTVNTNYNITTDKLFLLSPMEVGFNTTDTTVGTLLDYYIAGTSTDANNKRIKYRTDNNAYYWWFRTPNPSSGNTVRNVYSSGALSSYSANSSYGAAAACIIQ